MGGFCFRILVPSLASEGTEQKCDTASQHCLPYLTKNCCQTHTANGWAAGGGRNWKDNLK